MRNAIRVLLILVPFAVTAGAFRADEEKHVVTRPPVFGALHRGSIFTVRISQREGDKASDYRTELLQQALPDENGAGGKLSRHLLTLGSDPHAVQSWRICANAVWFGQHLDLRIPLDKLDSFDLTEPESYRWSAGPAHETKIRRAWFAPVSRQEFSYDFLPTRKDAGVLFVRWERTIVLWHGQGKWDDEKELWEVKWNEGPTIRAVFQEPFVVYALCTPNEGFPTTQGSTYYFLTESGKLYVCRAPLKGNPDRTAEAFWADPAQPIVAALTFTKAERTYLFVRPKDPKAQSFFFELQNVDELDHLGDKLQRQDFDPSTIKPVQAPEPLKTVLEYAQVLRERKDK